MKVQNNDINVDGSVHFKDKMTFDAAFRSYFQPLRFYATKFVDKPDAEDIVENLFLKLWNKQQVFESAAHLQAFLYYAVRNACLDCLRVSKRGKTDELSDDTVITDDDHLRYMIHAETVAEIYRAVNDLPSQCSKVIRMGYLDGFSNQEIARALGLSEQTVKNHKLRGLRILKQKLSGSSFSLLLLLLHN